MDADYYYMNGLRIANNYGFSEDILWNYLDNPEGIPHPSHGYWMPLTSILAAIPLNISGSDYFWVSKWFFVILYSGVTVITAQLAWTLTGNREQSILAGYLACLPGFYLPYVGTTDTFSVQMALGSLWFIVLLIIVIHLNNGGINGVLNGWCFLFGGLSGFLNLARVEGFIWIVVALFVLLILLQKNRVSMRSFWGVTIQAVLICLSGYFLVMAPWFWRNYQTFGSIYPPGSGQSIWLTHYNDLYLYPGNQITLERWWEQGFAEILRIRGYAIGQNLITSFVILGGICLFPLIVVGTWRMRKNMVIAVVVAIWVFMLGLMSFIFPYQGIRGGFFHAGASIQPMLYVVAVVGLNEFCQWGSEKRGWNIVQAWKIFKWSLIVFSLLISSIVVQRRVIGRDLNYPIWNDPYKAYREVGLYLNQVGVDQSEVILVNNPPGFNIATNHPAIVIPEGDVDDLIMVAKHYGVKYIVLEKNHPIGLEKLYEHPNDHPDIEHVGSVDDISILLIR
jgi:hypothetical protein